MDLAGSIAIMKRSAQGVHGIAPAIAAAWHLVKKAPLPSRCRLFKM